MNFDVGRTVMTRAIDKACKRNSQFSTDVDNAFSRYIQCDWGGMSSGDLDANDMAVVLGYGRIFASYATSLGKVWIITEQDRSYTTVLFPSDY